MSTSADLTAIELMAAYRAGELSPVEATHDVLHRIDQFDHQVRAFCLVDADCALEAAKASEQRWQLGLPQGLVDGVPTSIKDMYLTQGWPTLRGSKAAHRCHGPPLGHQPNTGWVQWRQRRRGGTGNGAAVSRYRRQRFVAHPGILHRDGGDQADLRPRAALADQFFEHLGTRRADGPHCGRRCAAARRRLGAGRSGLVCVPPTTRSYSGALDNGVLGLRIALSSTLGYVDVDPDVADAVQTAAHVFQDLGAEVEVADPGFAECERDFHVLWFTGLAKAVGRLTSRERELLEPGLREVVDQGKRCSALDYLTASATRTAMGARMGAFHERYDLLLTPTAPITPFLSGEEVPIGWHSSRWTSWTPFTYPFNMTQQPAASVPCGWSSTGLPIGLQVVGPRHADDRVLAACAAYERVAPWAHRRPPLLYR